MNSVNLPVSPQTHIQTMLIQNPRQKAWQPALHKDVPGDADGCFRLTPLHAPCLMLCPNPLHQQDDDDYGDDNNKDNNMKNVRDDVTDDGNDDGGDDGDKDDGGDDDGNDDAVGGDEDDDNEDGACDDG